ncbi:MAG TPA: glycosyltransferase, partial [Armatimonadota bacterium]
GRKVISTFGLIGPGKGLEYAVQAMAAVVKRHPDVYYYILGKTHPVVQETQGEQYREGLQDLARRIGVSEHVVFVDKYLSKNELLNYLQASDMYLTPYLDMEQITSGTLAYAMACGRPIVSTSYLHARFLLNEGRGILVPPSQSSAIADACEQLLGDPAGTARMERANLRYGKRLLWPRVGQSFVDLCVENATRSDFPITRKQPLVGNPLMVGA